MRSDQIVFGEAALKNLDVKIRELERVLGKKTMDVEILREEPDSAQAEKPILELTPLPQHGSG